MPTLLRFSRTVILIASIFGVVIFAGLFSITLVSSDKLEFSAQTFVKAQIAKEVREQNDKLSNSKYSDQLEYLKDKFDSDGQRMQSLLDSDLDKKISEVVAKICDCTEEGQQGLQDSIRDGWESHLEKAGVSSGTIENLIKGKYQDIIEKLRRDVRIFSGTNIIMFLFATMILLLRRAASVQLLLPIGLLLVSALTAIGLYVFGQNWFYTLIYSSFWGYAYSIYAAIIFGFLLDVFMNRARITTRIINLFGHSLTIMPC